jgi:amidase
MLYDRCTDPNNESIMHRTLLPGLALILVLAYSHAMAADSEATFTWKTIPELQRAMSERTLTAESLVRLNIDRINELNHQGPSLNAVIAINPDAISQARALDQERREKGTRGPLHGIPVLIKDNVETMDNMPTTGGSLALAENLAGRDAPIVAALRAAGAIILGKTNLSEWANIRSTHSISGWSAVGGLTRNPYVLDRTACGSSSGTGSAIAAGMAVVGIGTETDGSVICPSSINGLVGLKPTHGLLPTTGIIPISHSQDTAGPIARNITDLAILMTALVASNDGSAPKSDYMAALNAETLKGKRVGVFRFAPGAHPEMDVIYERALSRLRSEGVTLIEVKTPDAAPIGVAENKVLLDELKTDLNAYLASTPPAVPTRDLAALIEYNRKSPYELELFGQEQFIQSQATGGVDDPGYKDALESSRRLADAEGLDRLMRENKLDLFVAPTTTAAWRVDIVYGDTGGDSFTQLPAIAGYPHLTVPMGMVQGLPVGLSFIGPKWSDAMLVGCGFAFTNGAAPFPAPKFIPSLEGTESAKAAWKPQPK